MSSAFSPSTPACTQNPSQIFTQNPVHGFTWDKALHEFFLHLQATQAKKTQRYYQVQVGQLAQ